MWKIVTYSLICVFMLFMGIKTSKWRKIACLTFCAFCAFYAFYARKKRLSESCLFTFCAFCASYAFCDFSAYEIFSLKKKKKLPWYSHLYYYLHVPSLLRCTSSWKINSLEILSFEIKNNHSLNITFSKINLGS